MHIEEIYQKDANKLSPKLNKFIAPFWKTLKT